ncbi:DUF4199 domain-containing protein [Larkinella arboricola]|uniref:Uncharacterized protein DUF4199 n=1 Tax=Larkinella arboricola TaxID=643671 RepID=A0A327WPM1_LARAB|nr:DUF4199 domain-containing protein [Larkinella arboricola]RAJ94164.1 uncharacterized protein DUF4199 [Larkinella arboricola]
MKQLVSYFNHPLLKLPVLFGLVAGVLCFIYFLVLYYLGIAPLGNVRVPDFGFQIIMMVAAVWYYRKHIGKGFLHLWEALTICYVVNTVGALLTAWLIYLFINFVDYDIFTRYLADMRQLITSTKGHLVESLGQAEYLQMLKNVDNITPETLVGDEISKKTVLAVLPVLIISLLFRRQDYSLYNDGPELPNPPKSSQP